MAKKVGTVKTLYGQAASFARWYVERGFTKQEMLNRFRAKHGSRWASKAASEYDYYKRTKDAGERITGRLNSNQNGSYRPPSKVGKSDTIRATIQFTWKLPGNNARKSRTITVDLYKAPTIKDLKQAAMVLATADIISTSDTGRFGASVIEKSIKDFKFLSLEAI